MTDDNQTIPAEWWLWPALWGFAATDVALAVALIAVGVGWRPWA